MAGAGGRKAPELALRVASAVVLIAVALGTTWAGGIAFALLCAVAAILVLAEYVRIAAPALPPGMAQAAYLALAAILLDWFVFGPHPALLLAVAAIVALAGWEGLRNRTLWGAAGLAYAALPFMALVLLRATGPLGAQATLLLFVAVWATDIFAYFSGRTIGGPKLAPSISPNKTIAGLVGGLMGAVVAGAVLLLAMGYSPAMPAILLIAGLSLVSQAGDLAESWIKRRFGVKDSGAIIPGHGGVLDRIDGLVVAALAAWVVGGLAGGRMLTPGSTAEALFAAFVLP